MAMLKNRSLFSLFLALGIPSICVHCANIRSSIKAPDVDVFGASSRGLAGVGFNGFAFSSPQLRHVVPETYFQNGRFQPLFSGSPFPVTVEADVVRGGFVKVTLRAVNEIYYEIAYNNADGWVSNVRPTGQTNHPGTPDQIAAETKLKNIIANSQQLAFEKDGRLQFITDNGSTRISFDPFPGPPPSVHSQAYLSGSGSHSGAFSSAFLTRHVVPETYFQNGHFQPLYSGYPFPVTVDVQAMRDGFVKVTLNAVNKFYYEITYNNPDGWVSNVRPTGETNHAVTFDQSAVEAKLKSIIAKCQQIKFERDGRLQFITDNGSTRISFDPYRGPSPHMHSPTYLSGSSSPFGSSAFLTRQVVPETYFQNGHFQPLYSGYPFPITVDTQVMRAGFVKVTLKAVNKFHYEITYNDADGWVSAVFPAGETNHAVTADQSATEAKLKSIIAKCQQIKFEKDGRLQFIADNGNTRISFMF